MILFSKNLSFLRTKKSMTLSQITKDLGFSISQWSNYEQGISYPKFLDLIKISSYFRVSETELIHIDLEYYNIENLNSAKVKDLKENIIELQKKIIEDKTEKINNLKKEILRINKEIKKNSSLIQNKKK